MPPWVVCIQGGIIAFLVGYIIITDKNIEILKLNFDAKILDIQTKLKHSEEMRALDEMRELNVKTKAEMFDRLSRLTTNVSEEMSRITTRLNDFLSSFNKLTGEPVAFSAFMSKNIETSSSKTHQVLKYDSVELNIGNGYNKETGLFVAPFKGVYTFHVTTVAFDKSHSTIELVQNGVIKDIGFADAHDHSDRDTSSTLAVLSLQKGDVVNVRIGLSNGGSYLESNQYSRLSFSGFKLY